MLLPFGWMLATSLKSPPQIFTYPPSLVPNPVVWRNYLDTVQAMPFGRFYLNSLFVAVCVTTLQILTSSLAAFAFGRLRFRGREALFLVYLATLMIPFHVTMIPNFILVRYLRWFDTFYALIVPTAFSVFAVFLLRQYFRGIPVEMDEAARMDGASSFRIWAQVIMPLSGPVLAALTIFVFFSARGTTSSGPSSSPTPTPPAPSPSVSPPSAASTTPTGTCSWPAPSSPCCPSSSSTSSPRNASSRESPSPAWAAANAR